LKIALGTAQFGLAYGVANKTGQVDLNEMKAMLQFSAMNGIDTLDTAVAYGDAEIRLKEAGGQNFHIVTKLPPVPEGCVLVKQWVKEQVEKSLDRMGVDNLYGLLLHEPYQLEGPISRPLFEALENLKYCGLVQKIGVSIYSPAELENLMKHCELDLVQAPFNLVDRRLHTSGWMQRLVDCGVEIHTRSAFLQGLLLMHRDQIPQKFSHWNQLWDVWHNWQAEHNISAVQACLAFPMAFPQISRVVVGADSLQQLKQIIDASTNPWGKDFPDISTDTKNLINPSMWRHL
jgi:aryl-alcohol dehydrogenase-like predicted oxidoreductase